MSDSLVVNIEGENIVPESLGRGGLPIAVLGLGVIAVPALGRIAHGNLAAADRLALGGVLGALLAIYFVITSLGGFLIGKKYVLREYGDRKTALPYCA